MTINDKGYLSKDIHKIQERILQDHNEYFELARQLNKHVHSLKFNLKINNQDAQEVLSSALFLSLLESFNSLYILLSKGLVSDSKVILRSMLEKVIKIKHVIKSYENAIDYVQQDERIRLKFMNVILNDNSNLFSETIKNNINDQERDLLRKNIKKQGIKKPKSIEVLAKETGMLPYYNNIYRQLNSNVHSNSRSLESYFQLNKEGKITQLNWLSSFSDIKNDIRMTMFTAITLMFMGVESVNDIFNIEDKKFDNLIEQLKELQETVNDL